MNTMDVFHGNRHSFGMVTIHDQKRVVEQIRECHSVLKMIHLKDLRSFYAGSCGDGVAFHLKELLSSILRQIDYNLAKVGNHLELLAQYVINSILMNGGVAESTSLIDEFLNICLQWIDKFDYISSCFTKNEACETYDEKDRRYFLICLTAEVALFHGNAFSCLSKSIVYVTIGLREDKRAYSMNYYASIISLTILKKEFTLLSNFSSFIMPAMICWISTSGQTHELCSLAKEIFFLPDEYRTILLEHIFPMVFSNNNELMDDAEGMWMMYLSVDNAKKEKLQDWFVRSLGVVKPHPIERKLFFTSLITSSMRFVGMTQNTSSASIVFVIERLNQYWTTICTRSAAKSSVTMNSTELSWVHMWDIGIIQMLCFVLGYLNGKTAFTAALQETIKEISHDSREYEFQIESPLYLFKTMLLELFASAYLSDDTCKDILRKSYLTRCLLQSLLWFQSLQSTQDLSLLEPIATLVQTLQTLQTIFLLTLQDISQKESLNNVESLFDMQDSELIQHISKLITENDQQLLEEVTFREKLVICCPFTASMHSLQEFALFDQCKELRDLIHLIRSNTNLHDTIPFEALLASIAQTCCLLSTSGQKMELSFLFKLMDMYEHVSSSKLKWELSQIAQYFDQINAPSKITSDAVNVNSALLNLLKINENDFEKQEENLDYSSSFGQQGRKFFKMNAMSLQNTKKNESKFPMMKRLVFNALQTIKSSINQTTTVITLCNNITGTDIFVFMRTEWMDLMGKLIKSCTKELTDSENLPQNIKKLVLFAEFLTNELEGSLSSGMSLREFKQSISIIHLLNEVVNQTKHFSFVDITQRQKIAWKLIQILPHIEDIPLTLFRTVIQLSFSYWYHERMDHTTMESFPRLFTYLIASMKYSFLARNRMEANSNSGKGKKLSSNTQVGIQENLFIPLKLHPIIYQELFRFLFYHVQDIDERLHVQLSNQQECFQSSFHAQQLDEIIFVTLLAIIDLERSGRQEYGNKFIMTICTYIYKLIDLLKKQCKAVIPMGDGAAITPIVSYYLSIVSEEDFKSIEYSRIPHLYSFLFRPEQQEDDQENLVVALLAWISDLIFSSKQHTRNNMTTSVVNIEPTMMNKLKSSLTAMERFFNELEKLSTRLSTHLMNFQQTVANDMNTLAERVEECLLSMQTFQSLLNPQQVEEQNTNVIEGYESENLDDIIPTKTISDKGKQKKRRLRSRNRVVDTWLDDEDGDDAYADLEDFIVE